MDNIGLLLHKLTKYQTLLANVNNSQKQEVYRQKIAFYNNKMKQIGIEQQNLNSLNNLVGGELYNTTDLLQRLTSYLPPQDDKDAQKKAKEIEQKITEADDVVKQIEQNYQKILDTIKDVITKLEKEISSRGKGTCPNVESAKTQLDTLKENLTELNNKMNKNPFNEVLKSTDETEDDEKDRSSKAAVAALSNQPSPSSSKKRTGFFGKLVNK
jgi:hypothetical protein